MTLTGLPPFVPPTTTVPGHAPWGRGSWEGEEPVRAVVRIDGPQARWVVQHVGPDHVSLGEPAGDDGDGTVVVGAPVTNRAALRSFVLSFLEHAERSSSPRAQGRPRALVGAGVVTASEASGARLQRLLSMVPWIAGQDGPTVA